jgi:plastin-1
MSTVENDQNREAYGKVLLKSMDPNIASPNKVGLLRRDSKLSHEASPDLSNGDGMRRLSSKSVSHGELMSVSSGDASSEHTIDIDEAIAFSHHINNVLGGDPILANHLPLDVNSLDIFNKNSDGLILIQLIRLAKPDAINMKNVNKGTNMNLYKRTENLNLALKVAASIGCSIVNIGAKDLIEGRYEY